MVISSEIFLSTLRILAQGLGVTVKLFLVVIILSIPIGLLAAFCSNTRIKPLNWLIRGYVFIMRGTPLMLQLLFFYFGLPFIPGIGPYLTMDRFPAACVAFVLNYGAYFCEIFRGGIKSVEQGQYEAAQVLGLSRMQTVFRIVLPQMIKVTLPAICNETVTLVKDTALVTTLGLEDLMHLTKAQVSSLANVAPYGIAAVIYLVFILGLSNLFSRIETKTNY